MKFYQEIPVIRSIAAILVVAVHVIEGLYYSRGEFSNEAIGYIIQFARIGSRIFAIISAFLLMLMVQRKGFNLGTFVKSRFSKIFIPYLIWSTIYLVYRYHVEDSLKPGMPLSDYFLYGTANFHLYFILTVLQLYVVFPVLARLKKGTLLLVATMFAMGANYFWLTSGSLTTDIAFLDRLVNSHSFLLNWIAYFMMGLTCAVYYEERQQILKRHRTILLLISGLILVDIWVSIDLNRSYTSTILANVVYIPFVLVVLNYDFQYVRRDTTAMLILQTIGPHSMGIYLIHRLVIRGIGRTDLFAYFDSASMFVCAMIVTLAASISVSYVISLLPNGNYSVPVPKRGAPAPKIVEAQTSAS
jgi:peptidoglycan/LPS O-acetylase OafA/YrhL